MVDVSSASPPTDSIAQANTFTVKDTIYAAALNDYGNCHKKPVWSYMKKVFGCTWRKHNKTATSTNKPVSGRNTTTSFHEWYPIILRAKYSVTPSCAFFSYLNISLQKINHYLANVWRHSWSFWPFIGPLGYMETFCIFPHRPVFTCHRFAPRSCKMG